MRELEEGRTSDDTTVGASSTYKGKEERERESEREREQCTLKQADKINARLCMRVFELPIVQVHT